MHHCSALNLGRGARPIRRCGISFLHSIVALKDGTGGLKTATIDSDSRKGNCWPRLVVCNKTNLYEKDKGKQTFDKQQPSWKTRYCTWAEHTYIYWIVDTNLTYDGYAPARGCCSQRCDVSQWFACGQHYSTHPSAPVFPLNTWQPRTEMATIFLLVLP